MKRRNVEHLKQVALFSACSTRELELIARATTQLRFGAGEVLAREGAWGHEFIVIVDGKASVSIGERVVNTLAPGDFFGEIALLDHGPRTATVIAETDLIAEVIGQREFDAVLVNAPHLAKKVLVGLASRLRAADLHLVH
jgi:CRP-like cAMP-binding protein